MSEPVQSVASSQLHPAAPQHMPGFITAPGQTDVLMIVTAAILLLAVLMFGIIFFRLHTLPERIAHRGHKLQFEIVAVLGLIALVTHMHIFWVAGLLLALVDIPDFGGSLARIAGSAEKMAGIKPGESAVEEVDETGTAARHASALQEQHLLGGAKLRENETGENEIGVPTKPELVKASIRS